MRFPFHTRKSVHAMSGLKPEKTRYIKLRYCSIRGKISTISDNKQFITQSLSLLQTFRQARCLLLKSADIFLSCSNALEINICTLQEETSLTCDSRHNFLRIKSARRFRLPNLAYRSPVKFSLKGIMRQLIFGVLQCHTNRALKQIVDFQLPNQLSAE